MKILVCDFQKKKLISKEELPSPIEQKEQDPVLQRIKEKVDEQTFEVYKRTIEHYFSEAFVYQMEQENGIQCDTSLKWSKT